MIRVYLTGRVAVEVDGAQVIDERRFRGRQARLVFAYLVCERDRPVTRDELASVVWPSEPPPAWDVALSAILSRIRHLLADPALGLTEEPLTREYGQYQVRLPPDIWVDVEQASCALDEAESIIRSGEVPRAWGPAWVALSVFRRPFLSGESGDWVNVRRESLLRLQLRSLECFARVCIATGEYGLATEIATEAVSLDSYRESSHRLLMLAFEGAGDRAAGVRAFHRLRRLLVEDLGAEPDADTQTVYLRLLG